MGFVPPPHPDDAEGWVKAERAYRRRTRIVLILGAVEVGCVLLTSAFLIWKAVR